MEIPVTGESAGFVDTSVSTSWKSLDLSAYAGEYVRIWGSSDFWFCFSAPGDVTPSTVDTAGAFAACVADEGEAGVVGVHRLVTSSAPILRYATKTGSGALRVKPASRKNRAP